MNDLVIASLVAGPLSVGEPGFIGVQYTIKPGWHIYWENPGESGIPTEITLELPQGMTAETTRYPGPHSFMMPGDLINYGYEGQTTLLVPVTVTDAPSGTVTAKTRWLVCRDEQCVPGRATLTLELPTADPIDITAAQAHMPTPLPEDASVQRSANGTQVSIPGASIQEAFPNLAMEPALLQVAVQGEQAAVWFKEAPADGSAVVLRVSQDGAERFYTLNF